MRYAALSGDIISSTSLNNKDKALLERSLKNLLDDLEKHFDVYGRIIKGDYLECVVPNAKQGLRVALAIKSFVKSIPIELSSYKNKKRAKLYKEHGIRLAIGLGELDRYEPENGVMDGEAIYFSGRLINNATSTYDKERIVIKHTLFFASNDEQLNAQWEAIMALLDVLFSKATSRQSEVLYLKLLGNDEAAIAQQLGIDQSVVNRHSTSVGWNAIETTVAYFNSSILT